MVNSGYTRRQEFTCTLEELEQYANVVLYKDEILYVKQADGNYDILMGDGFTPVGGLRYVIRLSEIKNLKAAAETAKSLAEAAAVKAQKIVDEFNSSLSVIDGQINIEFEEEL